jgi:hypothetical protein
MKKMQHIVQELLMNPFQDYIYAVNNMTISIYAGLSIRDSTRYFYLLKMVFGTSSF